MGLFNFKLDNVLSKSSTRDVLEKRTRYHVEELASVFDDRVTGPIHREKEKRKKHSYAHGFCQEDDVLYDALIKAMSPLFGLPVRVVD